MSVLNVAVVSVTLESELIIVYQVERFLVYPKFVFFQI